MPHRTIYISDIHNRTKQVDEILSWEKYDKAIFGGDLWDSWGDGPIEALESAHWFKRMIADPRHLFALGNHDSQYLWPDNPSWCWGFSHGKSHAIRSVLSQADLNKLRPCHVDQGILFTHAGFDVGLAQYLASRGYPAPIGHLTAESIAAFLEQEWPAVCARYASGSTHPLLEPGAERGGTQRIGGITWIDHSRICPIPTIRQVVGHSIRDEPTISMINADGLPFDRPVRARLDPKHLSKGWVLGMDTCNKHYAILEGDKLTIKRVQWSRAAYVPHSPMHTPAALGDAYHTVTPTASSEDIVIPLPAPS